MNLKIILSKILDYLYYRKCYICSKKCYDISLCEDCRNKIFGNLKFKKAEKFGTIIYTGSIYEGEMTKIIRALKYHKKSEFYDILTDIILKITEHYNLELNDYIICPVPIHENRLKKRKYNHMGLVAEALGKSLGLEVAGNLLKRVKDTEPLYKLSVSKRREVIANAFCVTENIKDKKILLIDDIITSGSTIAELVRILNEKAPAKITVICASASNNCNFLRGN